MDLTISPILSNLIGPTSPTPSVGATSDVSSGSASAGTAGAFAQALQSVDTGPAGIRAPSSAEDLNALLSMVEMKLDGTKTQARDGSLATALQGRRADVSGLAGALGISAAALAGDTVTLAGDQATLTTDQGTLTGDRATLATDQGTLAGDQATLATDEQASVADGATLATDQRALSTDQATLKTDRDTLASDQASRSALVGQSAQLGTAITSLKAQAADYDEQIKDAQAEDPGADVSALTQKRDAALSQASDDQRAKDTTDAKASSYASAITADQTAVDADTEVVSADQTRVDADQTRVDSDRAKVDVGQLKVDADQAQVSADIDNIASSSRAISAAFGRLSTTLQTGDGQFHRNTVASQNLDRSFDGLQQSTTAIREKAADHTVRSNAALDTLQDGQQRQRDVQQLAASIAAGLAQLQASLAALQVQQAVPVASSGGRVRLSL